MNTVVVPYDEPWRNRIACSGCGCEIVTMNGEIYGDQPGQHDHHPQSIDEPNPRLDPDCPCRCHTAWKILRRVPA